MPVCRTGQILHQKLDKSFRPVSNVRRGRIAKGVLRGVSTEYYDRLKNTPFEELLAGNITHSLNKNILKVISHEIKKNLYNILRDTADRVNNKSVTLHPIEHQDICPAFPFGAHL